jgi:hypothetical protein
MHRAPSQSDTLAGIPCASTGKGCEGRLPRGINIERLRDPAAEWSKQLQELGLDPK